MKAVELINIGEIRLKSKKIITSKLDSELLLSKVLKVKREAVLTNLDDEISENDILKFNNLINRRLKKEPIAYILKEKEFWSKLFEINKSTLIPRPETELMVEELVKIYKGNSINILDIGTGSGCILISLLLELNLAKGLGIDISNKALIIAKKNSINHKVNNRVKLVNKSFEDLHRVKFDLIVSNPPYIKSIDIKNLDDDIKKFEPKIALDGGNDGLDLIKKVIYKSKKILKVNGILAIEIGENQHKKVSQLLLKNRFKILKKIRDYKSNIRSLVSKFII